MKAHSFPKANVELIIALGKEIRKTRNIKELTIEQFAEMCGLHAKYIQTIEQGKRNISISVFLRIAQALGIPPSSLLKNILAFKPKSL